MADQSPQLTVEQISLNFGGTKALSAVSFDIREGEILAIIGPNGAGKTSLLNCINNFYTPSSGSIWFEDREITKLAPYKIAQLGIARTFQNLALYHGMTTLENIMGGRHIHMQNNMFQDLVYWGKSQREELVHRSRVEEIIDFLEIEHIRKAVVGALP
ncbi:MAG: ATP-binding cassette domain-containing protein, partial [Anaerolineae bacterium]|nr:ATP-binding cassette domain-containing protein [Anaerolineae bacterium]